MTPLLAETSEARAPPQATRGRALRDSDIPHWAPALELSRYLRWHLNGRAIQVVGDARRKTRDFVHVSDAVGGLLAIAGRARPGEILNVGSGTEVSMQELAERIHRVVRLHVPHFAVVDLDLLRCSGLGVKGPDLV